MHVSFFFRLLLYTRAGQNFLAGTLLPQNAVGLIEMFCAFIMILPNWFVGAEGDLKKNQTF